ncbi:MAG: glycosyltransferase family 2 protein [Candidatus Nealsonbacteria bacterium]|nr:glycosyltransferase family 2 protein [Candidatus Nealsonbacteria bacterium]
MNALAVVLFWVLVGLVAGQALMVIRFCQILYRRARPEAAAAPYCPKTAVILCLRGPDPFLPACVEALLTLDYPSYDVQIIVDSPDDPARQIAEETTRRIAEKEAVARQGPAVQITVLTDHRDSCSLKCSSLLQAVAAMDESYEVVALLDADTVPHPSWLRDLVAPLADAQVGASTGNRWYMPAGASWGALVRYVWNSAAVVQMFSYGIPWGGTLALKTDVLRRSDLLDRWGRAFCEDTMVYSSLRKLGMKVAFVPSLMMVNREACSVSSFYHWVRRQLLAARLYHPGWPAVVVHCIGTALLQVAVAGLLLAAVLSAQWHAAAWFAAGLACYWGPMPLLLCGMEACVRRIVHARGEPTGWLAGCAWLRLLAALPLTQSVYPVALISALLVRKVHWRGVFYQIGGPAQVHLIEYHPYRSDETPVDDMASL